MQNKKLGFVIANQEHEYLGYFDRTEFGEAYTWVLHPAHGLRFETQEEADRAIKWIDYHSYLFPVLLIEGPTKYTVRIPQAQRSGSETLKSAMALNKKNQISRR